MIYLGYGIFTGEENMKIDSDMLDNAIQNKITEGQFRLYSWAPKCVSIGRNQKEDFLKENIDCVRRLTGGRALLHDDEITYSFVAPISSLPCGESVLESYKYISGMLIDFFLTLGVKLEFGINKKISTHFDYCMLLSTGADVCFKGKKIIGSAQYRKNGYILQHGSILFGYDKTFLEKLFNEEVKDIITVNDLIPDMTKEMFVKKLSRFIKELRDF